MNKLSKSLKTQKQHQNKGFSDVPAGCDNKFDICCRAVCSRGVAVRYHRMILMAVTGDENAGSTPALSRNERRAHHATTTFQTDGPAGRTASHPGAGRSRKGQGASTLPRARGFVAPSPTGRHRLASHRMAQLAWPAAAEVNAGANANKKASTGGPFACGE